MRVHALITRLGLGGLPLIYGLCATLSAAAAEGADATNFAASPLSAPVSALPGVGGSIIRLLGAFALVIAVLFVAVWLLRQGGRFNRRRAGQRQLQILEMRALGNRQSLVVVGYHSRRLLIATAPSGVSLLAELPAADPSAAEAPPAGVVTTFADALQGALGQHG